MKKKLLAAFSALTVGLTLSACTPGGGGPAPEPTSGAITDPAKIAATTITVLDPFPDKDSPLYRWMGATEKAFTDKYPNIKIKRESQTFDDITKTLPLRLSDPSVPDIVPVNQGWQGLGTLSGDKGLLLNLDSYGTAYGWDKSIPTTILSQHRVKPDNSAIGVGSLYGVPVNQGGFLTINVNLTMLKKLGLTVPTTLNDLVADMKAAKAAGEHGMMLGASDSYGFYPLLTLLTALGDPQQVRDIVFGDKKVDVGAVGLLTAATSFQSWVKQGLITPDYAGIGFGESGQKFLDGDGLFIVAGTDGLPFSAKADTSGFGTFILPRNDGGPLAATGSAQTNLSIAKNSKSPDAAALFLNFISGVDAGRFAAAQGISPLYGSFTANTSSPFLNQEITTLNAVSQADGYIPYFDWTTPTMLATIQASTSELLAGKRTPQQLVDAVQKNVDAFRAKKGKG